MLEPPALSLRSFDSTDVPFFTSLASNDQVTRYIGDGQPWEGDTIASCIRLALEYRPVNEVGAIRWFIATVDTNPVGLVASTRKDDGVEIGYWVSPEHWGKGIAGTMIDTAICSLPELFGTRILIAQVDPGNEASARVLLRRGFVLDSHSENLDRYIKQISAT